MGSLAIYWNCQVYMEFLYKQIFNLGGKDCILQDNLYCVLSSVEVGAAARLFSILHLAIVVPVRWLTGKTHTLAEYNWGPISMGLVLDSF